MSLDKAPLRIVVFTDVSFGNGADLSSQLGFIIVVTDASGNANVTHYGTHNSRRVTRSVMEAELLVLVNGFDNAFVAKYSLGEMLGSNIPLDVLFDSRTTFKCVPKHAPTMEKRLQIDINALRQSHSKGEIRCVGWISGTLNRANGLTRKKFVQKGNTLFRLISENIVDIRPEGWT